MSETSPMPERIDLSQAEDPRDVVHRAVACLAQGGIIGMATETVYGLSASALCARAVSRLRDLLRLEASHPVTLLLREPGEVADWVPHVSPLGRRWPDGRGRDRSPWSFRVTAPAGWRSVCRPMSGL